ncbi:hypothetical protein [Brevibacillus choshinensis]|uniref:hypothetical protein n=1 Tax=Brevibacillus choshinensis TaxID=54911 RepID=UPI000A99B454|nr:hypothetical protein [Brevibacillus choshinensis]
MLDPLKKAARGNVEGTEITILIPICENNSFAEKEFVLTLTPTINRVAYRI